MRPIRFKRGILMLWVVLLSATLSSAALPNLEDRRPATSLVGQLLIASPDMGDPRFYHAVVLIIAHSKSGALGIVINRPIGERSLASLLEAMGENGSGIAGSVPVFEGGPVQPQVGFVVHSAEYHRDQTIDIDGHVAMTSSPEVLRDIGRSRGPQKSLVAFGYAGWAPGQLEGELELRAWFTIPEESGLIFDDDRKKVWDDAMARRTIPL